MQTGVSTGVDAWLSVDMFSLTLIFWMLLLVYSEMHSFLYFDVKKNLKDPAHIQLRDVQQPLMSLNIMYLNVLFLFFSGCVCGGARFTAPTVTILFAINLFGVLITL